MFVGTKIEGEPDLVKDAKSKGIINTNQTAYSRYKSHQKSKITELAERLSSKKMLLCSSSEVLEAWDRFEKLPGNGTIFEPM